MLCAPACPIDMEMQANAAANLEIRLMHPSNLYE
jgi:hypothetical protein